MGASQQALLMYGGAGGGGGSDPYWANVVALLHFNGTDESTAAPTDETGRTWIRNSNIFIDTAQSVFGGSSVRLDYVVPDVASLQTANSADFDFGSGDFCIELRFRMNVAVGVQYRILLGKDNSSSTRGWILLVDKDVSNKIVFACRSGGTTYTCVSTTVPSIDTWYAVAVTRDSGTLRLFVNGSLEASTSIGSASINSTSNVTVVGNIADNIGIYEGWIDELRVTKGVARYTASYTPATAEFPNS